MSRHPLSEQQLAAGRECLDLLDEYGLGAQGAVWVYVNVLQEWRFYIVTSLVDIDGLVDTFNRIEKLFMLKFNNPHLTIDDIHLGSPNEPVFSTMANVISVGSGVTIELVDCIIQDNNAKLVVEHAYIYRLSRAPPTIKAKQARHQFDRKVRELERASAG